MSHPPFPGGATAHEIQAVQHLHGVVDRYEKPEVRQVFSKAVKIFVDFELIEQRVRRRYVNDQCDRPRDHV